MQPYLLLTSLLTLAAGLTAQRAIGIVNDRGAPGAAGRAPYVHVFDPDTLQITASIAMPLPNFAAIFDVEIAPDLREAYVSDFDRAMVWVIDLTTNPPSLATGINPIQLMAATAGPLGIGSSQDLALTSDGRFLVSATGNGLVDGGTKLAAVDLSTRTVTSSFSCVPNSPIAVETAPDGSVLVSELTASTASTAAANVRRLRLDGQGILSDTGELVSSPTVPAPQDLLVPTFPHLPAVAQKLLAQHLVHVSRPAGSTFGALQLGGLLPGASVDLDYPTGIDLNFDPLRSLVYVRTNELGVSGGAGLGNGRIEGFFFSPFTGRIGNKFVQIDLDRRAGTAFGVEQTAVDPRAQRLFVSGLAGGEVRVYDSLSGAQVGSITHPDLLFGLGIAVRRN